jgi:hypothetical protein
MEDIKVLRGNMNAEGVYHINETFFLSGFQLSTSWHSNQRSVSPEQGGSAAHCQLDNIHQASRSATHITHTKKEHFSEQFHSFFYGFTQMTCPA